MKKKRFIWSVLLWIIYWLLITSFIASFSIEIKKALIVSLVIIFFQAIVAYTNNLVLIPLFLKKKKFLFYFLSVVLTVALLTFIRFNVFNFKPAINIRPVNMNGRMAFGFVSHMFLVYLISTAYHFVIEWFRNSQLNAELKNKQLESELKFLKTQINPHFLFNTLNNIYTLCYLKDDKAAPSVIKLSKIMRYMLHESNVKKIEINKEIKFLENYIELQKLKKDDPSSLNITFTYSGIKSDHLISPLLLISFFENCFKHGDIDTNPKGWIKADLRIDNNDVMCFIIENTKTQGQHNSIESSNIGLKNTKKRLELQYGDSHELQITDNKDIFKVYLKIPLER